QRAEQVERRAHTQVASRLRRMLHRRMKRLCKEKRDPGVLEAALGDLRRGGDVHFKRLEEIRAAAAAGGAAVAVLRHADAAGGEHERRDGGDVEGMRAVAARPAR